MTKSQAKYIIESLTNKGIYFDSGLTNDEILQVEETFQIKLPPDLKLLLQIALPISDKFVN